MGASGERSRRSSSGETSQAALTGGSEGNMRAKGFSSRCFSSRKRRTASSWCAATIRWKPPSPFTARIWPWRMASAAAAIALALLSGDRRSGGSMGARLLDCGSGEFTAASGLCCCVPRFPTLLSPKGGAPSNGTTTPGDPKAQGAGRRWGRHWAGRGSGGRVGRHTRRWHCGHSTKPFMEVFARS